MPFQTHPRLETNTFFWISQFLIFNFKYNTGWVRAPNQEHQIPIHTKAKLEGWNAVLFSPIMCKILISKYLKEREQFHLKNQLIFFLILGVLFLWDVAILENITLDCFPQNDRIIYIF